MSSLSTLVRPARTTVAVRLLGVTEVNGARTRTVKPLELVLALALAGGEAGCRTLERHLYGDMTSRSALATLAWRARGMGIWIERDVERSTYRLTEPVDLDVIELLDRLERRDLEGALDLYGGPCLARSTSPVAVSARRLIEERMAREAARTSDPALALRAGIALENPRLARAADRSLAGAILADSLDRADVMVG